MNLNRLLLLSFALVPMASSAQTVKSLSVKPAVVAAGSSSAGTITLNGPAPAAGLKIALSCEGAGAHCGGSVTVPAGKTSTTFPIATTKNVGGAAMVRGTLNEFTASATLTVTGPCGLMASAWPKYASGAANTRWGVGKGATGHVRWSFTTGGTILSAPAVDLDGNIYFGSDDGNVYSISSTGRENWEFKTGGVVESSPAVGADGTVYVGSADSCFYAINPDGALKWAFKVDSAIFSSPSISADGVIYIGSANGSLYALNLAGDQNWNRPALCELVGSPAIGSDGTIYVGGFSAWFGGHCLLALTPAGELRWSYTFKGGTCSAPSLGPTPENLLYVTVTYPNGTELDAFGAAGVRKWSAEWTNYDYASNDSDTNAIAVPVVDLNGTVYIDTICEVAFPDQEAAFHTGITQYYKLYSFTQAGKEALVWGAGNGSNTISTDSWFGKPISSVGCSDGTVITGWTGFAGFGIPLALGGIRNGNAAPLFSIVERATNAEPSIGADGTIYFGTGDTLYAIK